MTKRAFIGLLFCAGGVFVSMMGVHSVVRSRTSTPSVTKGPSAPPRGRPLPRFNASDEAPVTGAVVPDASDPFRFANAANPELVSLVRGHVSGMGSTDSAAEDRYQQSLAALHARRDEVVLVLMSEYRDLPPSAANARWAMIETLTELRHPDTTAFFNRVLTPESEGARGPDPRSSGEALIAMAAIRGLDALAADGNRDAHERLRRHALAGGNRAIRVQAAVSFSEASPDPKGARMELRAALPPGDRWMADVVREKPLAAKQK